MSVLTKEREAEAADAVAKALEIEDLANLAIPRNSQSAQTSSAVASIVAYSFERFIEKQRAVSFQSDSESNAFVDIGSLTSDYDFLQLTNKDDACLPSSSSRRKTNTLLEKDMYPYIQSFFDAVASAVGAAYRLVGEDVTAPLQTLTPFKGADRTPKGSDDTRRIDIGLKINNSSIISASDNSKDPDYSDMLAVLEAKGSVNKQKDAYKQLFEYSRNLYVR
ncbi:hypothetical protein H4R99_008731, partial [Coemansia sp. RSA 1722]